MMEPAKTVAAFEVPLPSEADRDQFLLVYALLLRLMVCMLYDFSTGGAVDNSHGIYVRAEAPKSSRRFFGARRLSLGILHQGRRVCSSSSVRFSSSSFSPASASFPAAVSR